jgi:lysozyme
MSFRTKAIGAGLGGAMLIAAPVVAIQEGLVLKSYPDPVQIWTACYGHVGPDVQPGRVYTESECVALLHQDLAIADRAVDRAVQVPIASKTKAALISFVFNVGEGNFRKSTLLRMLNAGEIEAACNQLSRWVYAKGIRLRGLAKRREVERQLCLDGWRESRGI